MCGMGSRKNSDFQTNDQQNQATKVFLKVVGVTPP